MCGIAGVISRETVHDALAAMARVQIHRGPDGQDQVVHKIGGWNVGMAHQRLSIIDLSDAAAQPMLSSDKGSLIIYNGEVYNYYEIRRALENEGVRFRTQSDTEVVIEALRTWGAFRAFQEFNGMWSLAWLDLQGKKLLLARDRLGVKPLYYYLTADKLVFASEIKTILVGSQQRFPLNYRLINANLVQNLLDIDDETFFLGINKLTPAHFAVIDLMKDQLTLEFKRFWDIPTRTEQPRNVESFIEELREVFLDAVRLRLRSDVPVGALLSGGVDSSSIVGAMHHNLGRKSGNWKLLSTVSRDRRFDESPFIDSVSNHFGIPVHKVELDFTPQQALELLEQVTWFNDEPVGSFSNVAHYLLMQKAKDLGITVILTGQGGDELLAGYIKYTGFYIQWLLRQKRYQAAFRILWDSYRQGTVARQFSIAEAKRYVPVLARRQLDVRGPRLRGYPFISLGLRPGMSVNERQILDLKRYSIPVLLHTEDRMSMAVSREIRVPFLDYRLIEMLVPLQMEFKIRAGWNKWVFRKAMEPFLPREVIWRRDKQSFVNPQSEWLKHELREQVERYFTPDAEMFRRNLVDRENLMSKYATYCRQPASRGEISYKEIFAPLALEIWLRNFAEWIA